LTLLTDEDCFAAFAASSSIWSSLFGSGGAGDKKQGHSNDTVHIFSLASGALRCSLWVFRPEMTLPCRISQGTCMSAS
jgi:hypothetical protein